LDELNVKNYEVGKTISISFATTIYFAVALCVTE